MSPRPSPRYRPFVSAMLACGHWEQTDRTYDGGARAILRHKASGRTISYATHDTGNDSNGARNMAHDAGRICGCTFIQHRSRKRSRKAPQRSGFNLYDSRDTSEHEQRRLDRHAELVAAQLRTVERIEQLRQQASREASQQARDTVRRLRHIEQLLEQTHLPYTPYAPA